MAGIVKSKQTEILRGMFFVLPGVAFALVLRYYPMVSGIISSLYEVSVVDPPGEFVGLGNYRTIFRQAFFWNSWRNTMAFLFLLLAVTFWVPIVQALAIDQMRSQNMRSFFSTLYLVPVVIPISASVVIWKTIWNADYGFANTLIQAMGGSGLDWLVDPHLVKFSIVFPGIMGGGLTVLIYLAALYAIPQEQIDAARVDGATEFEILRFIKLPNITFIIRVQLVYMVMMSLQYLDMPFQMTQGGPNKLAETVPIYIYNAFQQDLKLGRSSAAAFTLFVVIAVFTFIQLRLDSSTRE